MEVGNQSTKHWQIMDPIKEIKIESSRTKFIIKTFPSACVFEILPKLGLQDQQLWEILSSTNVNNLHAHEVNKIQRVWTLILSISSSSSYTWSTKKITHIFSFFLKAIMVLVMFKLHEPFWVHVCLTHVLLLLWNDVCAFLSSFDPFPSHVFVIASLKIFLMVPVYTKFQEFASLSPSSIITSCVLAI